MSKGAWKAPIDGDSPFANEDKARVDIDVLRGVVDRARNSASCVMSIDQALDCVGLAFYFPDIQTSSLLNFLGESLCRLDARFVGDYPQMRAAVGAALGRSTDDVALVMKKTGDKTKPVSFGMIFAADAKGRRPVILNGQLARPVSNIPEWKQARGLAGELAELGEHFAFACRSELGKEPLITLEGMASHGDSKSVAVLPCLGIVYGAIWEEIENRPSIAGRAREIPISSWKKALGKGNFSKNEVKQALALLGFARFGSDDEQDAVAMSLAAAASPEILKETHGRVRPTIESLAAKREESKAKKARKADRLARREERR